MMRKLMILALMGIAMLSNYAVAQKIYDFTSVEKEPTFPGGISKFYKYMGSEIKYHSVARNNKTEGKVFVSFVVEESGKLTDVNIVKGLSKETDDEALRVINNSPKWNPGLINGKAVRVKYNINVNFNMAPKGNDKKASTSAPSSKLPEYPGGSDRLYAYLTKNMRFPEQAKKDNVQGKVYLSFNIEKDGTLTDIEVTKGLSVETDAEALRLIKSAPRWNPAIGTDGRPVITKYRMAINFTIS